MSNKGCISRNRHQQGGLFGNTSAGDVSLAIQGMLVWQHKGCQSDITSIQFKNFNYPTRDNFVVVMAGLLKTKQKHTQKHKVKRTIQRTQHHQQWDVSLITSTWAVDLVTMDVNLINTRDVNLLTNINKRCQSGYKHHSITTSRVITGYKHHSITTSWVITLVTNITA